VEQIIFFPFDKLRDQLNYSDIFILFFFKLITVPLLETIKQQFEEVKKGNISAREKLFESMWTNFTNMAHDEQIHAVLLDTNKWANAHAAENPEFLALCNLTLGTVEFLSDNYDLGAKYLNKAYDSFVERKDEDGAAATSVVIGFSHRGAGDIDLALKFGLPGMEHLERCGKYKMFQIVGNYWIGSVYAETGHLDEAFELFQKGLHIDYPRGIESMAARLTNGVAGVYMKQKKYSLALEYYQKALDLCESTTEITFKARGLTDLADYYVKMGNFQEAIRYNEEALAIRQGMKIQNAVITNLMNLGDIYNKQGKFNDAIKMLTSALKLAEEIKVKVKMYQIHQLLSNIYLGMGNITDSLAHYKSFHEIREDVNHEELDHKVKNQVQLFQAQQTQKENAVIKAQKIEIEKKNIALQETIDELTLAKISKKAKALTLSLALVLFIFQDKILETVLHIFASDNYWLSLSIKIAIIFSLEPVNKAIEHYLLRKVIKRQKKEVLV
jgi:tetratricopeptide (TPR) repeat protein